MKRRILIVDDDRLLAETLRAMIAAETDAEVRVVTSSARAASLLEADVAFDAVICDLGMPGGDGISLHERLNRNGSPVAERFLFMTGGTFSDAASAFLARTRVPCLNKPFESAELHAALADLYARTSQVPRSA